MATDSMETAAKSNKNMVDLEDGRPYWLLNGCPSWCHGEHEENEEYASQLHSGRGDSIDLSAENPQSSQRLINGKLVDCFSDLSSFADLNLEQHYRETEPRLWIGKNGTLDGFHMTLAESRDFTRALVAQIHAGRGRNLLYGQLVAGTADDLIDSIEKHEGRPMDRKMCRSLLYGLAAGIKDDLGLELFERS